MQIEECGGYLLWANGYLRTGHVCHVSLGPDPHYRTLVRKHDVVPLILRRAMSCTTAYLIYM